jgi:hypothetical protein
MLKKALIAFVASSCLSYGFEGEIKILTQGKSASEHASLIAPHYIITRWHSQTEKCQQYPGACTFQGIPIVHIETFNDYAVMTLEREFQNYLKPIEELHDLSQAEQATVCRILADNNSAHVQEDSCTKIRQRRYR